MLVRAMGQSGNKEDVTRLDNGVDGRWMESPQILGDEYVNNDDLNA